MNEANPRREIVGYLAGVILLLALLLVYLLVFPMGQEDSSGLRTFYERTVRKSQLITTMNMNLLASTEAEKSSVMADTDEASQASAEQSMRASAAVEEARRELALLLEGSRSSHEKDLFGEFSTCWEQLQVIDREILSLAVQNTNLKALRLSFFPAGAALRRMEEALEHLMNSAASCPEAMQIMKLANISLAGAFKIHTLHVPHVVETSEAGMNEVEAAMKEFDEQVNNALSDLEVVVNDKLKSFLDEARSSWRDFQGINAEIIALSRQNTNIRSFAMSLGQKRNVTAQCQENLTALHEAVLSRKFEATR